MHKPQLVAVDTNVLLRLADGHEATIDAWQLIKRRLNPVQFILLPTVLGELASKLTDDADPRVSQTAVKALKDLRLRWDFQPTDVNAVEEAVAANAVQRLRDRGIVPYEERNGACSIAEAAVQNSILLVSRDSHLLAVDSERLAWLLRELDLPTPVITSPEKLVKKFYR